MSVMENLGRDEGQQFDARVFTTWECPIERNHNVLTEQDCFACASIAVLAYIDFKDEDNELKWEARRVLYDFFEKDR